jgi:hypothetical protein
MYRNLPREYTDGRREFSGYCELDPTLGISSTTVVFTGLFHKNGPPANLIFSGTWILAVDTVNLRAFYETVSNKTHNI